MIKNFPNRVGQTGTYVSGTPNSIDVSGGAPLARLLEVSDASLVDGQEYGLFVEKDVSNWQVWTAIWDNENTQFLESDVESSMGTLTDSDEVSVVLCPTESTYDDYMSAPYKCVPITVSGTSRTLSESDAGKLICCTSSSAVTVTIDDSLPVGFHCVIVQEGAGGVSIAKSGTDTINGGAAAVSLPGVFTSSYLYQRTEGVWVALI